MQQHFRGDWIEVIIVYYIYSAAVQTMPKPLPMQRWYTWLYSFLQVLGANLKEVFGTKESAYITTTTIKDEAGDTKTIKKVEEVK